MNFTFNRSRALPSSRAELRWTHCGIQYRVTAWPDVRFERETEDDWEADTLNEDVRASAAVNLSKASWITFLNHFPTDQRDFLNTFKFGRLDALQVITECPELLPVLRETPALMSFIACHCSLRGTSKSRWSEINAVYERSGLFGLLDWLGLPSSRQTLSILENIVDPDVPRRLLAPLRAGLWQPATIHALQLTPAITDRQLAIYCNAMAA